MGVLLHFKLTPRSALSSWNVKQIRFISCNILPSSVTSRVTSPNALLGPRFSDQSYVLPARWRAKIRVHTNPKSYYMYAMRFVVVYLLAGSFPISDAKGITIIVASSSQDDDPTVSTTVLCSAPG
jgi:hypothetical protein